MKEHTYCVYIMASKRKVLYIGVTNDIVRRVLEHKEGKTPGFTKKYQCYTLVYYESDENIESVIIREKQMKKWNRQWKVNLIESVNPAWEDLSKHFGI